MKPVDPTDMRALLEHLVNHHNGSPILAHWTMAQLEHEHDYQHDFLEVSHVHEPMDV